MGLSVNSCFAPELDKSHEVARPRCWFFEQIYGKTRVSVAWPQQKARFLTSQGGKRHKSLFEYAQPSENGGWLGVPREEFASPNTGTLV
jgi:hypothetical protein